MKDQNGHHVGEEDRFLVEAVTVKETRDDKGHGGSSLFSYLELCSMTRIMLLH